MHYRADVDGLRAIAVLPVLLFHFGFEIFSGGFVGVDVFFVISGYVISLSILDDLDKGRFSIARFYFKRVRRILPALTVVLLATTGAATLWLLPDDLVDYNKSLAATSLFVANIYFWQASGYFAADAQLRPLLHMWSLSVEEQYYVVMPIAIALIYRFGRGRWLLFFAPVLALSFAFSVFATSTAPTANFFILPTRAWELLLGALIALTRVRGPATRWQGELVTGLGLGLILYAIFALSEAEPFPGINALYPCLGSALVIYGGLRRRDEDAAPLVTRLLSTRPFVWIGLISYSLYLVHWPIAVFVRYLAMRDPELWQQIAMLAASIGLAWLSWRFIEQPFRRPWPGFTVPRMLAGGAATLLACAAIGGVGVAAQGLPQRYPEFARMKSPEKGDRFWKFGTCFNMGYNDLADWTLKDCTLTDQGEHRILLWGDSFAAHYTPGIIARAREINAHVVQYTYAGCPPILSYFSYARANCTIFNRRVPDLIRTAGIDTVVMSARWTDLERRGFGGLADTVAALNATGAKVYVIGQTPEFPADIRKIDFLSGNAAQPSDAWALAFDPAINQRLRAAATGATFIDPLPLLCQDRQCRYQDGQIFLYSDYGHFSPEGAAQAVTAYFPKFGARDRTAALLPKDR